MTRESHLFFSRSDAHFEPVAMTSRRQMALVHGTSWGDDWGVFIHVSPHRRRIASGTAAPASAANQDQNGLVNVAIGDITISDVNIGVAAQIAAQICGVKVGPVAVLGAAVDRSGAMRTVCESEQGDVTLTQS